MAMVPRSTSDDRLLPAAVPAAAKAAFSPSALVLAGGGAVLGVVVGLPVVAALVFGAGLWVIRVGTGAALAAGRRSTAARPEMIDPYAVPEPWRSFVAEALSAQTRFDQAVIRSRPGPLRDRLSEIAVRVHTGTLECWRVANLGAALHAQLRVLDPSATSSELRRFQQTAGARLADDQTEAALAARLQAARSIEAAYQRVTDRLRSLTAALHSAVAHAIELALDGGDAAVAGHLAGNVKSIVGDLETLRRALEETAVVSN